jgi:hypothetical protein
VPAGYWTGAAPKIDAPAVPVWSRVSLAFTAQEGTLSKTDVYPLLGKVPHGVTDPDGFTSDRGETEMVTFHGIRFVVQHGVRFCVLPYASANVDAEGIGVRRVF